MPSVDGVRLARLVVLFCLENDGWPAGIFPLAFSDMPRNCNGTASPADDAIDAALGLCADCAED